MMYYRKVSSQFFLLAAVGYAIVVKGTENCPKPKVYKNNQIDGGKKVAESVNVQSAKQCYSMCCDSKECTTSMIKYERVTVSGDDGKQTEMVTKNCQLLNCRASKCSLKSHSSFAVIEIPKPVTNKEKEDHSNSISEWLLFLCNLYKLI